MRRLLVTALKAAGVLVAAGAFLVLGSQLAGAEEVADPVADAQVAAAGQRLAEDLAATGEPASDAAAIDEGSGDALSDAAALAAATTADDAGTRPPMPTPRPSRRPERRATPPAVDVPPAARCRESATRRVPGDRPDGDRPGGGRRPTDPTATDPAATDPAAAADRPGAGRDGCRRRRRRRDDRPRRSRRPGPRDTTDTTGDHRHRRGGRRRDAAEPPAHDQPSTWVLDLFGAGILSSDGTSVSWSSAGGQAAAISQLLNRILDIVVNGAGSANALTVSGPLGRLLKFVGAGDDRLVLPRTPTPSG